MKRILVDPLFISMILVSLMLQGCSGGTSGTGGRRFSGRVITLDDRALANAIVTILQTGESGATLDDGSYTIESATRVPEVSLQIKSATADSVNTSIALVKLPEVAKAVTVDVIIDEERNIVADSSVVVTDSDAGDTVDETLSEEPCLENGQVCARDNVTYENICLAEDAGQSIAYDGACLEFSKINEDGSVVCIGPTPASAAVCGVNNETYPSRCLAMQAGVEVKHAGECSFINDCRPDRVCNGITTCPRGGRVCGKDNRTYTSAGHATASGVGVAYHRECINQSRISDCRLICTGPPLPEDGVCGSDGIDYSSECEAIVSGANVVGSGSCTASVDCDTDAFCGVYADCPANGPVCGKDNTTYESADAAARAGVGIAYRRGCLAYSHLENSCTFKCTGPPPVEAEVCGADGMTYVSECVAIVFNGVAVASDGPCV